MLPKTTRIGKFNKYRQASTEILTEASCIDKIKDYSKKNFQVNAFTCYW